MSRRGRAGFASRRRMWAKVRKKAYLRYTSLPKRRLVSWKQVLPGSCWRINPRYHWPKMEGWDCQNPSMPLATDIAVKPNETFVVIGLTRTVANKYATHNGLDVVHIDAAHVLFEGERLFTLSLKTILREALIVLRAPSEDRKNKNVKKRRA